jgi:hypothetical protein
MCMTFVQQYIHRVLGLLYNSSAAWQRCSGWKRAFPCSHALGFTPHTLGPACTCWLRFRSPHSTISTPAAAWTMLIALQASSIMLLHSPAYHNDQTARLCRRKHSQLRSSAS